MKLLKSFFLPLLILCFISFSVKNTHDKVTERILFDFDWKFTKGDLENTQNLTFDDSTWKMVNLPHDWSIEGPFSKDNPAFSRGGWLPTGKCTYRKTFEVSKQDKNKRLAILFDGAYRNSEVWINGHLLGKRPLGYIAFHYNLTEHIKFGEKNVITVKLDNSNQPGSRWYTGTGIYRHVYLIKSDKLYIPIWGTYINSNNTTSEKATLKIESKVQNSHKQNTEFEIKHTLINPQNQRVDSTAILTFLKANESKTSLAEIEIINPDLWSPETPDQYTLKTELIVNGEVVYWETNKTGIRNLSFNPENGFNLNGKNIKLKGVCLHHDGGPLGAAVYRRTIERQLEILREMGCNAVRTAHNPFSEEFLDVCDEMGFLVMNEMFDEWEIPKDPMTVQNGKKIRIPVTYYAQIFNEWADKDLTDFVLRDRNHPSVIMWSIGNEIDQMRKDEGAPISKRLIDIIHKLDYRPVTNGVNGYSWDWPSELSVNTNDIRGYNYIDAEGFDIERKKVPNALTVVTECQSAQSFYPRSTYIYGEGKKDWWNKLNYEHNDAYEWVAEREIIAKPGIQAWRDVKKRSYVMGQFIWTGWDYLGEVIPFGWPSRSSVFAPIDLAGFPKDGYYFYQSQWTDTPMVHIYPHWNLQGNEGKKITVYAFTNGHEIELFQDGKSLGKQKNDINGVEYQSWQVTYSPGELKAISYKNGKHHSEKIIKTAGKVSEIRIFSRRKEMLANGQDLIYVEFTLVDKEGNLVPKADNLLQFKIEGPATIAGVGNGNNMSHEPFIAKQRKAFNGKCLAIIKSTKTPGAIRLNVSGEGFIAKEIVLHSKNK